MRTRELGIALLLPLMALALQWVLWPWIKPFVWFLFFPAIFFAARSAGLSGGLLATFLSIAFVWYFFIPPQLSWEISNPNNITSIFLFLVMGYLFSDSQERLRQAGRKIERALEDARTANTKINDLYQKTLELDHLKTQFFSNVSHELRTPLTLILGPLDTLLATPDLDEGLRHSLEIVARNARFLYRHVADLLDVAKLEAQRMTLRYSELDLARLTRVMASHFESVAEKQGLRYEVRTPEHLTVQADGEKIERILLNLLSNAFKFVPAGGTINVTLSDRDQQAILAVSDNGPGIPAALRNAVFERFRQLDGDAERSHGGTGLGLSIVKEFVDLHAGKVDCRETPGGGATFAVNLPLTAPPGTTVSANDTDSFLDTTLRAQALDELWLEQKNRPRFKAIEPNNGPSAPLVLVVEDNPDMNAYIIDALRPRFRIATAFNGEEGLRKALEIQPDLILTDLMMPKMSGDRMTLELRRHPEMVNVPIVMLTAKTDEAQRIKLLEAGIQEYLTKPFSVDELLARLGNLVSMGRETERTRLELAAIVESSDAAIIGKTLGGIITSWNHGAERLFGYRRAEVVGKSIFLLFPENLHGEEQDILAHIAGGQTVEHFETTRLCKDGRTIDVSATISPIKDRQGRVIGASKIARDITRQKADEKEIRRLNTDLERRVEERTQELQSANRELDSFAYAVSHDLRAPLRAMEGFARAIEEDYGERLPSEVRAYLDEIMLACRKMADLLEGILALSRITRGNVRRDEVDLSAIAEQIRRELTRATPDRNVVWEIESAIIARGDPRMLEAVMRNLLGNAWKYSALAPTAHIRLFTEDKDGKIRFCVQDNGAGFDMAHADKLFKPFQRLHRQDEFAGLGIGLATVQCIVHRHGGTIEATAAPGQGATFRFTLAPAGEIGSDIGGLPS